MQKAAEAGNPDAMMHLGLLYEDGKGVAVDYGTAREWYQKAAAAGRADANRALARQSPPPTRRQVQLSGSPATVTKRMTDEEIRANNEKVFERLGISPTPPSPRMTDFGSEFLNYSGGS